MDLIISGLLPVIKRLETFCDVYSAYILTVLITLTVIRVFVGFCLFRKMEKPALLGAIPVIGELSLYAYLGLFIFVPVKFLCLGAVIVLDILSFTAPADGGVYLLFMLPFLLLFLLMHLAFSIRICRAFNAEWYFVLAVFFLPIVFIPVLAFGRREYFGLG